MLQWEIPNRLLALLAIARTALLDQLDWASIAALDHASGAQRPKPGFLQETQAQYLSSRIGGKCCPCQASFWQVMPRGRGIFVDLKTIT